jgi:hypothetical protein
VEKVFFVVILSAALFVTLSETKGLDFGLRVHFVKDNHKFLRFAQDRLRRLRLLRMTGRKNCLTWVFIILMIQTEGERWKVVEEVLQQWPRLLGKFRGHIFICKKILF